MRRSHCPSPTSKSVVVLSNSQLLGSLLTSRVRLFPATTWHSNFQVPIFNLCSQNQTWVITFGKKLLVTSSFKSYNISCLHLRQTSINQAHLIIITYSLSVALLNHYEFLQHLPVTEINVANSLRQDFFVPLICNTYSTSQDIFQVS